jgi:hypothetical protein
MNLVGMVAMWKTVDDLLFKWSKSIILDDAAVEKCRSVGVNIAKAAADMENAQYLGDKGVCPNCHSRNFYLETDGTAICEVCGIEGKLVAKDGGYGFEFDPSQYEHAHNMVPGKMKHMDDIAHYEGRLAEQKKTPEFKARVEKYKSFIEASKPERA